MALERTYLIGVIASYPIVLFFGPFAHFHGNLTLKLFRMADINFIRCCLMILRLLELVPSGSLFAAENILQGKRFFMHLWNGEVNFNNFVQVPWVLCQRMNPL